MKYKDFYGFKIKDNILIDKKLENYIREFIGSGLNCFNKKERIQIIKDFLIKNNIKIIGN